jgi:hypothetical protein
MFNLELSRASSLVLHYIGNKLKDEELILSNNLSDIDQPTRRILWQYITGSFKSPDFQRFTHPSDLEMNPVLNYARKVFHTPDELISASQSLAKLLYDASQHPQVKSGELMVIYFPRLVFAQYDAPAIGLFKSEKKHPFLFTEAQDGHIDLYSYQGIDPGKVDKAAIIFDTEREDGYVILAVDNAGKGEEARFWFDNFLKIERRSTEFAKTSAVIDMTRSFLQYDLSSGGEFDQTRRIAVLQNSREYFRENDHFDMKHYAEEVLEDKSLADRFREYTKITHRHDLDVEESFDISPEAVRKKQSVFRSVLKLDKNFHIYVHGDRSKIERGIENGRKYYKLYYDEES